MGVKIKGIYGISPWNSYGGKTSRQKPCPCTFLYLYIATIHIGHRKKKKTAEHKEEGRSHKLWESVGYVYDGLDIYVWSQISRNEISSCVVPNVFYSQLKMFAPKNCTCSVKGWDHINATDFIGATHS